MLEKLSNIFRTPPAVTVGSRAIVQMPRESDSSTVQFTMGSVGHKGQWGEEGEDEGRRGMCRGWVENDPRFTEHND